MVDPEDRDRAGVVGPVAAAAFAVVIGQLEGALGGDPLAGLAGNVGDQVEVLVVVEDREAGALGGHGDDRVRQRWGAVQRTAFLGQRLAYVQRTPPVLGTEGRLIQAPEILPQRLESGAVAGAVEKLPLHRAANRDLAGSYQAREESPNLDRRALPPGYAPSAGIGKIGRHRSVEIELPGLAHPLQLVHEVLWQLQLRETIETLLADGALKRGANRRGWPFRSQHRGRLFHQSGVDDERCTLSHAIIIPLDRRKSTYVEWVQMRI